MTAVAEPALTVGTSRCRCGACGRSFGGVGAFDMHQRLPEDGTLRCLDPVTVGLALNPGGWWVRETPVLNNGVGQNAASGDKHGRRNAHGPLPPVRGVRRRRHPPRRRHGRAHGNPPGRRSCGGVALPYASGSRLAMPSAGPDSDALAELLRLVERRR